MYGNLNVFALYHIISFPLILSGWTYGNIFSKIIASELWTFIYSMVVFFLSGGEFNFWHFEMATVAMETNYVQ
jgi:hypothetical protein